MGTGWVALLITFKDVGYILFGAALGLSSALLLEAWKSRAQRKRLAVAIAAELEGLFERYMEVAGDQLGKAKCWKDFQGGILARQNYFAIFDSNASSLGFLAKLDAVRVAKFYVTAKGHLDNLAICYDHALRGPDDEVMTKFFPGVRRDHDQLTRDLRSILALLRQ